MIFYREAKNLVQKIDKQVGFRMVQANNIQQKSKSILEAKTFLVIRAAQRVFQKLGNRSGEQEFRQALEREFEFSNIKYRHERLAKNLPEDFPDSYQTTAEFLCMNSLILQLKLDGKITDNDDLRLKRLLRKSNVLVGLIVCCRDQGLTIHRVSLQHEN